MRAVAAFDYGLRADREPRSSGEGAAFSDMKLRSLIVLLLTLAGCAHSPPRLLQPFDEVARKPASETPSRSVLKLQNMEIFVSDIDRCEEKPLTQKLSNEQIQL
jgi:hypothetical protein